MFRLMTNKWFFTLFYLCWFSYGNAIDYKPWLGNFYEFELYSTLNYQSYSWLSTGSHHINYPSNDIFLNLTINNSIPDPAIGIEFEATQAKTRKQRGEIDQLRLTGRYLWLDDIMGDPYSIITGFSYIQAFKNSLKDVSSFHHGLYNTEFFVSIGKEKVDECVWGSRCWGMFAVGIAEQGLPWLRLDLNYDKRLYEKHEFSLLLHSLWGLGGKSLKLSHFRGYGLIKHQSVDLGIRYTYLLECYGNVSLEYSYRLYANNFPSYTHRIIAQILYTFGL